MIDSAAKLNSLAAAELSALEADGIRATPAEIVELNALGWAVECPSARMEMSRGYPVEVAGLRLWPLTLYAAGWLERVAASVPADLYAAALAYAMAHAYSDGGELDSSGARAVDDMRKWVRSLRCTARELAEAVDQVESQDEAAELPPEQDAEDSYGISRGDYSAFLSAATMQPPEFWERRCSQAYTFRMLHHVIRQKMAEGGHPVKDDAKIKAEIALGWAAEKIRQRHAKEIEDMTKAAGNV